MNKRLLAGAMIILMCMTILSACSPDESSPPPTGKNLVLPIDIEGVEELLKIEGCPLMIVAMAAWCAPCRSELPALQRMHEKYKDRGLRIVGISLDIGGPSAMQPLVDQMGLEFPIYWGGEEVTVHYRISGIPLSYFVRNGEVVDVVLGGRDETFIEEKIVSLLDACEQEKMKG
ncbi:MAG: TlpA family protein disulfide reductase [Deltaproteobacteria bacterium]|nr:TlpA family protein disulfide reductase [Deltaproteobacteria bacterium]